VGYLDRYGEGEEKREKFWKRTLLIGFVIVVALAGSFLMFRNIRQERRVKLLLEHLRKQDYRSAYALWGCTESTPCRDYPFESFLQDWGPQSPRAAAIPSYRITRSRSCGSGVVLTLDGGGLREFLWVENRNLVVSFSPYPGCPNL
jgi:hypothetical protein